MAAKKVIVDKSTSITPNVGTNIKLWRERKSIKQEVMAKTLGISTVALSNIENNKSDITISRLVQIANTLEINPSILLSSGTSQYFVFNNCEYTDNEINHNSIPEELLAVIIEKLRK
jgi:transcriptional regulator with XRE-family HTH domain